jgi:hypothetical protein
VYGNVNILWVCGVIHIESLDNVNKAQGLSVPDKAFDAWPSKEANDNTPKSRRAIAQKKIRAEATYACFY